MPWKRSLLIRLTMTCIYLMMGGYAKGAYYVATSSRPQDVSMWVKKNMVRNYFTNPDLFDQAPRHTTIFARPHLSDENPHSPYNYPLKVGSLYIEATSDDYENAKRAYIKSKLQGTQQLLSAHRKTKINNEDFNLEDGIGLSCYISMFALLYYDPIIAYKYSPSTVLLAVWASGVVYMSITNRLRERRASKWKEEKRALKAKLSQEEIDAGRAYETIFIREKQQGCCKGSHYKINISFIRPLYLVLAPSNMRHQKRDPLKVPENYYSYDAVPVDMCTHHRLVEAEKHFKKAEELEDAVSLGILFKGMPMYDKYLPLLVTDFLYANPRKGNPRYRDLTSIKP